jgi:hypothetical protein
MSFLPLLRPFIMSEFVRRSIYFSISMSLPHIPSLVKTYDGALSLAEALDGISASRMGDIDRRTDLDVVSQRDVTDLNTIIGPLVEELGLTNLLSDILGQDLRADAGHDFFGVGHFESIECRSKSAVIALTIRPSDLESSSEFCQQYIALVLDA